MILSEEQFSLICSKARVEGYYVHLRLSDEEEPARLVFSRLGEADISEVTNKVLSFIDSSIKDRFLYTVQEQFGVAVYLAL